MLCNPFTLAVIPPPPTTALGCVKETDIIQFDDYIGCWFYLKVVLSCDPSHSHRDDYVAMAIYGNNQVAFARAGESTWRLVREMPYCHGKTKTGPPARRAWICMPIVSSTMADSLRGDNVWGGRGVGSQY
jgi:hypothetical protein